MKVDEPRRVFVLESQAHCRTDLAAARQCYAEAPGYDRIAVGIGRSQEVRPTVLTRAEHERRRRTRDERRIRIRAAVDVAKYVESGIVLAQA